MNVPIVPCPNGRKCGSPNHRTDSAIYQECLAKATASHMGAPSPVATAPPPPTVPQLETNELPVPNDTEPSVWVGSKQAYQDGKLVGRWFSVEDAYDVEPVDVFEGSGLPFDPDDTDDLWVFDTNNMPIDREMSR